MAQIECDLQGDFDSILQDIEDAVSGSYSATEEGAADFFLGDCRCAVRVYERYSLMGANRVSLSVTLLQKGEAIKLSAITSGGSQAVLFKMNTFGEEAFLRVIEDVIDTYQV